MKFARQRREAEGAAAWRLPARQCFHRAGRDGLILLVGLVALVEMVGGLAGCAATGPNQAVEAATTPLRDLNLVRADIPMALLQAMDGPYVPPAELGCAALSAAVAELDAALGPDVDAVHDGTGRNLVDRLADEASGAATGALQRTAEGVIPFRGWIRKLSGAERQSRRLSAALTAGGLRRAYLKGLLRGRDCR